MRFLMTGWSAIKTKKELEIFAFGDTHPITRSLAFCSTIKLIVVDVVNALYVFIIRLMATYRFGKQQQQNERTNEEVNLRPEKW